MITTGSVDDSGAIVVTVTEAVADEDPPVYFEVVVSFGGTWAAALVHGHSHPQFTHGQLQVEATGTSTISGSGMSTSLGSSFFL